MKNSRFIIFSLHLLVFSILFYFGNRIVFLFLSEGFASLELADRIMEAINQSFAEIAEFAIHIEFAQMSLLSGFVFGIAYILLVLYKTFDSKNTRPNEEYGSARWGKPGDIRPFIDKKKDFNILLTKIESLSLSGRMKITKRDN
ncbi:MAG: type IV secretory system conjugative DNA transfer family protein, partial [Enterococcus sp.]